MNAEIEEYFASKGIPVDRIVKVGVRRRGLSKESIERSIEQVYEKVKSGEQIEPIRLAWEIYGRSSYSKVASASDMYDLLEKMKTQIDDAIQRIDKITELSTPWYTKLRRKWQ